MALELTSTITAADPEFRVTGTVPDTIGPGFEFRLGNELCTLQAFGEDASIRGSYARQWAPRDRNRWIVNRGVDSVAVSHTAGTSVLAANDAFGSSADLTPPSPFSAGGGIPEGWTQDPETGAVDTGGQGLGGLPEPSADDDAATKGYVDDNAGGSAGIEVLRIPFAFNTPNILTGITIYTPAVGDLIQLRTANLNPVVMLTPWNVFGSTLHVGWAGEEFTSGFDLTQTNDPVGHGLTVATVLQATGAIYCTDATPIKLWVDDGAAGDPGAAAGSAVLYLTILKAPA